MNHRVLVYVRTYAVMLLVDIFDTIELADGVMHFRLRLQSIRNDFPKILRCLQACTADEVGPTLRAALSNKHLASRACS